MKGDEVLRLKKLLQEIKGQKLNLFSEKVLDVEVYKNLSLQEKFVLDTLSMFKN
ncbi:MAG: hypothetical protein AB8B46_02690 [Candidatus Midichloriaceae bacterium]